MAIIDKIESLTISRNSIRSKMITAGQASRTDKLAVLAQNLTIVNTSDATATADDIVQGKTAYARDQKLIGTYVGIDTSDATATANDILEGKSAYVDGQKIVGTFVDDPASYTATSDGTIMSIGIWAAFQDCYWFNEPVTIGSKVTNCYSVFAYCNNFNQPVAIPDSVISCSSMFRDCYNFNQPVIIGNNATDCSSMFRECYNLNKPVTIGNKVTNCRWMFINCFNFNQPITVPDSVTIPAYLLYGCRNFNQPVTIGRNAVDYSFMFFNCLNFGSNIYIRGTTSKTLNVRSFLAYGNSQKRKNIWFNSVLNSQFNKTDVNSIVGAAITWTSDTNCFYNSAYNIYCYYNYSG